MMEKEEEKKPKKRVRLLTMRNVYDKKISKFQFDGMWAEYISPEPEDHGIWLIYGAEKNGKTTFALMLANYLRQMGRVLYLSAEEGISGQHTGYLPAGRHTGRMFQYVHVRVHALLRIYGRSFVTVGAPKLCLLTMPPITRMS